MKIICYHNRKSFKKNVDSKSYIDGGGSHCSKIESIFKNNNYIYYIFQITNKCLQIKEKSQKLLKIKRNLVQHKKNAWWSKFL